MKDFLIEAAQAALSYGATLTIVPMGLRVQIGERQQIIAWDTIEQARINPLTLTMEKLSC